MKKYLLSSLAALALSIVATGSPLPDVSPKIPFQKREAEDLLCIVVLIDILVDLTIPSVARQASSFCSGFIETTTVRTVATTQIRTNSILTTVDKTVTATTTVGGGPAPTVTQIVYENCGIVGYDAGIAAYRSDATANSYAACNSLCTNDADCASFAYSTDNCLLYRAPVLSNTNPVASSPFTFFDRNCPLSAGPSAAPVVRRAEPTSTPIFFALVPKPVLSTVCTCIITRAPVITSTSFQIVSTTQNVVATITSFATVVQTVGGPAGPAVTKTITTTA